MMHSFTVGIKVAATHTWQPLVPITAMIEDKYWYIAYVHAASLSGVNPSIHSLLFCTRRSFQHHQGCQSSVTMDTTTAIQQITNRTKKSFPSSVSVYASLSASPPASVGLCNFLSESLPACLHICLPTCFSTSTVRPQRDNIFFSREKTEETMVFFISSCLAFICYNTIWYRLLSSCFIVPLFHFSPLFPSLCSLPAPSCAPSLQAGRKAGWGRLSLCQS